MDADDYLAHAENIRRDRQERNSIADAASNAPALQQRSVQTNVPARDSGYWNGPDYKEFFRFGVSKFGDGSVFK